MNIDADDWQWFQVYKKSGGRAWVGEGRWVGEFEGWMGPIKSQRG